VRWLVVSVAIHALVLWLLRGQTQLAPLADRTDRTARTELSAQVVQVVSDPTPTEVVLVDSPAPGVRGGGHGGGHGGGARVGHPVHADPWGELALGVERPEGARGSGTGRGTGFGFGDGGGIATRAAVPLAPEPPPPSRARPARLIHPSRDREVEDDDDLFVARVTVDEDGDVVAVHMMTTHPGARGDQAASAIWTFRYAPALDDAGAPVRATFEQPFQIR